MAKFGGGMSGGGQSPMTPGTMEAIMGSLQGAKQSAAASGSPWAAALTPIATAMIGKRAQSRFDASQAQAQQQAMDKLTSVMGGGDRARELLSVMMDPAMPDEGRKVARNAYGDLLDTMGGTGSTTSGGGAAVRGGASGGAAPLDAPGGGEKTSLADMSTDEIYGIAADPNQTAAARNLAQALLEDKMTGQGASPDAAGGGGLDLSDALRVDEHIGGLASAYEGRVNPDTGELYSAEEARSRAMQDARSNPLIGPFLPGADGPQAAPTARPRPQETPGAPSAPSAPSGPGRGDALPRPQSAEEMEALPSGTRFIDPEGNERVKP